jgi:hypothetical protein
VLIEFSFYRLNKNEIFKSNLFHFKVNTKRERRSSNNKNNISKQPQTESNSTIGALVTGLTSTQANMSDDTNQADTLVIKPTSIEINNQPNGTVHENGHHSPSKSLKLKLGSENEHEPISTTNGHHPPPQNNTTNDHIYETPSNIDSNPPSSSFETPTISSSDEQGNKHDERSHSPSTPPLTEHHLNNGRDSGLSSEMTNANNSGTETEKTNLDDESSSTSGITSSSIISAARLLETNVDDNPQQRESSPISGVIIPEEKRVTDRVKVFEAAANNEQQSTLKKQAPKNGNQKKPSTSPTFSSIDNKQSNGKREQQSSPTSSLSTSENLDNQTTNESKSASTKNKSKRPSLKKQIQNLLKIDKPTAQEESTIVEEQPSSIANGKKSNTLNPTRNKRDNGKSF